MSSRIIPVQAAAPSKPAVGLPCNGCGVCCLYEPCPLGQVLSRRRHGACAALRWDGPTVRYVCGAVTQPRAVLQAALPRGLRWSGVLFVPVLSRLARRWIAAGQGCDCDLEVLPLGQTDGQSGP
jgi:hypothetical protein